jgi:hypothetical protein
LIEWKTALGKAVLPVRRARDALELLGERYARSKKAAYSLREPDPATEGFKQRF